MIDKEKSSAIAYFWFQSAAEERDSTRSELCYNVFESDMKKLVLSESFALQFQHAKCDNSIYVYPVVRQKTCRVFVYIL